MKRFIWLTSLYVLLLIGLIYLGLVISSYIVSEHKFKNHETESNLLVMNNNDEYDILFMGISHSRNFSRHKNHLRIENILERKIVNIGQGGGQCGVNEQLFYLDYFYGLGNKASTVLYIISPPLFFSETLPIASNTFDSEPFELKFFLDYWFFETENKQERLTSYLQTKLSRSWISYKPSSLNSQNEELDAIDLDVVVDGQKMAYKDSISIHRFNKSTGRVEETIRLALKSNSNVILLMPPALFGKWKGHGKVEEFAKRMQKISGVEYYDFSESVLSPEFYYDHHHLNTNGVIYFTKKFLKPIL